MNIDVGDNDEDEVQEIRRTMGRDKAIATGKNKGSKASGSSSMNDDALAREYENASINLNIDVGDNDEDEVQEIRRTMGRDKAIAAGKNKGSKASGSSTSEYRQRQEVIRFYLQPYDYLTVEQRMTMDEAKAKIKAK
nr:hypothetical protein [Tanacetum cinerariifolium]